METVQYQLDSIEATNYRIFKSLSLQVNGNNLHVVGMPDGGKTTLVGMVWEIIESISDPITTGKSKGEIKLAFSDKASGKKLFAIRKFTAKSKTIVIKDEDGEKVNANDFKKWFLSLAKNPQDIADLKPLERLEALQECVDFQEGVDINQICSGLKDARDKRKAANQKVTTITSLRGIKPKKVAKLDTIEINRQYTEAQIANRTFDATSGNVETEEAKIEQLEAQLALKKEWVKYSRAWMEANPRVDTTALEAQINNGTTINAEAALWDSWVQRDKDVDVAEKEWQVLEDEVVRITEVKAEAIENASMPLPGLDFGDGDIIYNGLPLEQSGDSVKTMVCCALVANRVSKSKMPMVRMDGTEHMAEEHVNTTVKLFNDLGIQVFSGRVHRKADDVIPGEIVISEGEILDV